MPYMQVCGNFRPGPAKNFSLGQMERMLAYAHNNNRHIYITLNTLVKEQELPGLVETLAELARLRVDGVIVQDMAVARLVRMHFPSIPLHASTQMTIHNLPGVQLLEELGFERVVLARELQLADIASIASRCKAELEVFIHGALCFCVSGQCHFSSLLGGHSGNRGRCAQPCRRLYSHRGKEGYFFSPNDLSAIEMVPDLVAAGVKSLKIEGRMKSADYVAKVVSAYRLVLDAGQEKQKDLLAAAKSLLKDSFGRAPTKGFLESKEPVDIANPWLRGGTGRFIGEVKRVANGRLFLKAGIRLRWGTDCACNRKPTWPDRPGPCGSSTAARKNLRNVVADRWSCSVPLMPGRGMPCSRSGWPLPLA